MSQPPFSPGMPYLPPIDRQVRTNGWAIASFVCSLLCCVPLITQLLAFIFGIVGLRAARTANSGKGLSIAGIVLAVLFALAWSAGGVGMGILYVKSQPVRAEASAFIHNAAAGNTAAALAETDRGNAQEVDNFSAALASTGSIQSIYTFAFYGGTTRGGEAGWQVAAAIYFDSGKTQTAQLTLVKVGDTYKIKHFLLQPTGSTTLPTVAPFSTSPVRLDRTIETADRAFAAAF